MPQVIEMGPSPLRYHAGYPNRIGIIDPSLDLEPRRGGDYFTTEPSPTLEYKRKLRDYENGERKTRPKEQWKENTGTAPEHLAAFLDWSYYGDAIFIHYMTTHQDARKKGYGTALVQWIYDKAQREGKVVDWGKVFYDASRIFDKYRVQYPGTRGHHFAGLGLQLVERPMPGVLDTAIWEL